MDYIIRYDYEEMLETAAAIRNITNLIGNREEKIEEFKKKIERLRSSFQGKTAEAFFLKAMEIDSVETKNIDDFLRTIAGILEFNVNEMQVTDSRAAAEVRGIFGI